MRHITRISFLIFLLYGCAALCLGQDRVRSVNASVNPSMATGFGAGAKVSDPTFIPAGSKV
jgi:hypothetical protein